MSGTVFVLGSINADTTYRMTTLPGPGETVSASSASISPGGKGANQAIAAAAGGASTRMVGVVGDDADALMFVRALAERGVNTEAVVTEPGTATGRAVVYVDDAGENSIVVLPGANGRLDHTVAEEGLATISIGDVLVLQNEVPAESNRVAAAMARSAGAKIIWNAAPAPASTAELVTDIDLLVVNEHELLRISSILGITKSVDNPTSPELPDVLTLVSRALDTDAICTLGPAGAMYCSDNEAGSVAAPMVLAVDTTAAGDTFVGYLAAHADLPIDARLRLAAGAGALAVTHAGASSSIPQLSDVEVMLAASTERTSE